jgi:hypothetical protein
MIHFLTALAYYRVTRGFPRLDTQNMEINFLMIAMVVMYRVYGHCYTLRVYLYEQCWCIRYRKTVLHCRNIYTNFSVPSGNFYSQPYFTHQYPLSIFHTSCVYNQYCNICIYICYDYIECRLLNMNDSFSDRCFSIRRFVLYFKGEKRESRIVGYYFIIEVLLYVLNSFTSFCTLNVYI